MNRRQFLAAAGVAVSAPYVLRFTREAKGQGVRVRRNLSSLSPTDPFFTQYGDAVRAMHALPETDARSWRGQALIHANFCPHGAERRPDFILWHRHYITYFEQLCGSLIGNADFSLPYWDWTANNGRLPAPFSENGPLNVAFWRDRSDHLAANWDPRRRIETRAARFISATRGLRDDPRLRGSFTPASIDGILAQTNYSLFQGRLEGSPHNDCHILCGGPNGHMGSGLSPLDPIFWLHHCNVDRLAAQWQRRSGNQMPQQSNAYNGQFVDARGAPQNVTAAQAIDFASMGFTYDLLAEAVVASREERQPEPRQPEPPAAAPPPPPAAAEPPARPGREEPGASAQDAQRERQQQAQRRSQDDDLDAAIAGRAPSAKRDRAEEVDDILRGGSGERRPERGNGRSIERHDDHSQHAAPPPQQVRELSVLGRSENARPCSLNRATQIPVSTARIFNEIVSGRAITRGTPSTRSAVPNSRILARLSIKDFKGEIGQCLVNVFVNAPQLPADTTTDNPHYVGSFSFFGRHYFQHGGTFLVDVGAVVRDQAAAGQLGGQALNVQVLPVQPDPTATPPQVEFVVNQVELISG